MAEQVAAGHPSPHPSPRVVARQANARRRILAAARVVVSEQGFAAAQVAVVASVADVATFVDRALRGEGLAYAVIAEPMDPDVDQVRLEARAGLAHAFARLIEEGIASGELADQDAGIRGAAIVGAFLEGVVAPLAEREVRPPDRAAISAEIARFCRAAVACHN